MWEMKEKEVTTGFMFVKNMKDGATQGSMKDQSSLLSPSSPTYNP